MPFCFAVTLSFFAAFSLSFATCLVSGGKIPNNTAVAPAKNGDGTVVCNHCNVQYLGQDAKTHGAIKTLDAKVDKLSKKLDTLIELMQGKPSNLSALTCKEIYDKNLSKGNKAYLLSVGPGKIPVYCHMTSAGLGGCGGGGWTLVMKINGAKRTFHYNSKLWSNKINFNLPGGKTGFDTHETKLPTYWKTPFDKICLAMKIGQQFKSIVIHKHAFSLYSLIADGKYRATSLGRNTWKILIGSQASLQLNCNREGFNAQGGRVSPYKVKARIGILGNNEKDCNSPDSRIGFGTGGSPDDSNTCGNEAEAASDNGDKHIKAMGYILVQ